jgi:hypothetical protein
MPMLTALADRVARCSVGARSIAFISLRRA